MTPASFNPVSMARVAKHFLTVEQPQSSSEARTLLDDRLGGYQIDPAIADKAIAERPGQRLPA